MKMKKLILMMAIAAAGAGGCEKRPEPLKIDNALTAEEIAAGRLTPEVMWKMSRAGGSSLSPDGRTLLYQQTDYNMAEKILTEKAPIAPIYQYTNGRLIKPWVKGYPINNPEDVAYSRTMYIEKH